MTPNPCPQEADIVRAVIEGAWPEACAAELREHAAQCATCTEVADVAAPLRHAYVGAARDARLPSAGQVWWRAAIRSRLEAAHAASRPISWIQGLAAASAAGLATALVVQFWPIVRGVVGNVAGRSYPDVIDVLTLVAAAAQQSVPLLLALAFGLLIAPIAVYLALSDD